MSHTYVMTCDNCGYQRTNNEDGEQMHEVCGICYEEDCKHVTAEVLLCQQCHEESE